MRIAVGSSEVDVRYEDQIMQAAANPTRQLLFGCASNSEDQISAGRREIANHDHHSRNASNEQHEARTIFRVEITAGQRFFCQSVGVCAFVCRRQTVAKRENNVGGVLLAAARQAKQAHRIKPWSQRTWPAMTLIGLKQRLIREKTDLL